MKEKTSREQGTFLRGDLKIQNLNDKWLGLRLRDH